MKFAYYPGCSARSTCAELNVATHRVAVKLGLHLLQLESATCTGARELRAIDPAGFYALNVRILAMAERSFARSGGRRELRVGRPIASIAADRNGPEDRLCLGQIARL